MEILLSFCIGIGLSAACGLRIFVPFLVMNLAARSGHLTLSTDFQWIAGDAALIAFVCAVILEILAYYVPWVDNFLDAILTPAAIMAGSLLTASQLTELSPFLQWSLAIIAGGGTAGMMQGSTVLVRGSSTAGTGGMTNALVATGELGGSVFLSVLTVFLPLLVIIFIGVICFCIAKIVYQLLHKKPFRPFRQSFREEIRARPCRNTVKPDLDITC